MAVAGSRVTAVFVSGHLRNNLMLEETFLLVERRQGLGWTTVARDADWETRLEWHRTNLLLGERYSQGYLLIDLQTKGMKYECFVLCLVK